MPVKGRMLWHKLERWKNGRNQGLAFLTRSPNLEISDKALFLHVTVNEVNHTAIVLRRKPKDTVPFGL